MSLGFGEPSQDFTEVLREPVWMTGAQQGEGTPGELVG